MAEYRCWGCNKDVKEEEAVWLDRHGRPVDWRLKVVPADPAAYHATCASSRQWPAPPAEAPVIDKQKQMRLF